MEIGQNKIKKYSKWHAKGGNKDFERNTEITKSLVFAFVFSVATMSTMTKTNLGRKGSTMDMDCICPVAQMGAGLYDALLTEMSISITHINTAWENAGISLDCDMQWNRHHRADSKWMQVWRWLDIDQRRGLRRGPRSPHQKGQKTSSRENQEGMYPSKQKGEEKTAMVRGATRV